jgi:hypothetical protein
MHRLWLPWARSHIIVILKLPSQLSISAYKSILLKSKTGTWTLIRLSKRNSNNKQKCLAQVHSDTESGSMVDIFVLDGPAAKSTITANTNKSKCRAYNKHCTVAGCSTKKLYQVITGQGMWAAILTMVWIRKMSLMLFVLVLKIVTTV